MHAAVCKHLIFIAISSKAQLYITILRFLNEILRQFITINQQWLSGHAYCNFACKQYAIAWFLSVSLGRFHSKFLGHFTQILTARLSDSQKI